MIMVECHGAGCPLITFQLAMPLLLRVKPVSKKNVGKVNGTILFVHGALLIFLIVDRF